jgi:hypothetical protein
MMEEQEFENITNGLLDALGVGPHNHAVGHRRGARGYQLGSFFDFHEAHPAAAFDSDIGVIAIPGDMDTDLIRNLDDGSAFFDLVHLTVQRELRHNRLEYHGLYFHFGPIEYRVRNVNGGRP